MATNAKELAALKRLGERNYFDINLGKTKQPQRVGDISLLLKKTDPKRNKYTIEVMADDKTIEKKDKTANEPIQFLTAKGGRTALRNRHQPGEEGPDRRLPGNAERDRFAELG